MVLDDLSISRDEFETGTGWHLEPRGACKGEVCIPLDPAPGDPLDVSYSAGVDVRELARQMGLPLVGEASLALWALGPECSTGRALTTAQAPPLQLPDLQGRAFDLARLRGQKIVVYAWAPY